MKTSPLGKAAGNILLIVLLMTGIIGFLLLGYLSWVRNQNVSVMRSQAWNSALALVEAGIEDALTHLNANGITNLASNGWIATNQNYMMVRALNGGYYSVVILPNNNRPIIESTGFSPGPLRAASTFGPLVANAAAFPVIPQGYLSRKVRATTTIDSLFARGMVAKGNIDFRGNNVRTDSFDSGDPNFSTNGNYDSSKNKDNGDVATNSGLVNSLSSGNANILGKASTGPGGTISLGPNGAVGSKAWQAAGNKGIESGWSSDDMNVNFPEVKPPFTGGSIPTSSGGGYLLPSSGNYQMQNLDKTLIVRSNVQAVLLVTITVNLVGQDKILLEPGASLKLYVSAPSAQIGGNGVVNPGNATNFYYYGLPSNTSLSFSGNAAFTGAIYAPNADFTLGGGGNNDVDFVGASITSTVKMNGHFKFHYDENLRRVGPPRQYIVTSWNEI